ASLVAATVVAATIVGAAARSLDRVVATPPPPLVRLRRTRVVAAPDAGDADRVQEPCGRRRRSGDGSRGGGRDEDGRDGGRVPRCGRTEVRALEHLRGDDGTAGDGSCAEADRRDLGGHGRAPPGEDAGQRVEPGRAAERGV